MSRVSRVLASRAGVRLACVAAGLLIAASLPPWGWWPLAFAGLVLFDRLVADQPTTARFWRGMGTALAFFVPSYLWMGALTPPGYVIACLFYGAMYGIGAALVPPRAPTRWLALPAAWVLVDAFRGRWPFGGVPVSTLAHAAVASPLAPVVRVAGPLLLIAVVVVVGVIISAAADRRWGAAALGAAVVVGASGWAAVAPRGHDTGTIRVAIIQGGGPQGTRAEDTDAREVFERHLAASQLVQQPVDLVLWPENVVEADGSVIETREGDELSALARQLDTTLLFGVTERYGDRFFNAQVVVNPDGSFGDRYDKVRRVPFGEYVPFRSLLQKVAGDVLPPRDALAGAGHGTVDTAHGRMGVAISWEIFFADRARDAIGHGGEVLMNPTNGSSYTGTWLQTQQIAASRLRALETGRWVVQGAPTGFSAIVTPDGKVTQRSAISERRVIEGVVSRRSGQTIATRLGDWPVVGLCVLAVAGAWALHLQQQRHRPVVDEGDVHVGPELAGGDGGAELTQPGDDRVDERLGVLGPGGRDP